MGRKRKKKLKPAGSSPGTLIYTGEQQLQKPIQIDTIDYDAEVYEQSTFRTAEDCLKKRDRKGTLWINVEGVHDVNLIERIGHHFNLHPLTLEDILNVYQRPKREDYEQYIFITIKMLSMPGNEVLAEQVSLIMGDKFLISFQEGMEGDPFDPVRERLRGGKGRIRKGGMDYLTYCLIDVIVDNYFSVLEKLGESYEVLEQRAMNDASKETLRAIHEAKKEILFIRKAIWPLREIIIGLLRDESKLFTPATMVYLRDLYDHVVEAMEIIETMRDMIGVMLELYMTSLSNRTNEIMKMLALISTIFMPLTFIAGIYGMNFEHMPELRWVYGYPMVLGWMVLITCSLVIYFRKKGWI